MSHSQIDSDLDDKISMLYLIGHSTYQIGDRFDIDRKHVRRALRRAGVPLRSRSEAMKLRRELVG
jgi:hypothetical protein